MRHRIDIIGAGISGLATGYYLMNAVQSDHTRTGQEIEIHIWEKDVMPGGLAGSFATADFAVEKFYHHIYRQDVALQELIAELDFADDLVWRPAATGAYYFRQPYRLSSPIDLLRFKPLALLDRFRLGWLVLQARRIKDWRQLDDVSAQEYIRSVAGESVYRVVWEPLFHGKFGPYSESVSAAWLWSKLVDRGGSRNHHGYEFLGYLRGGLGRMFEALVNRLQAAGHTVHLGKTVRRVEGSPDRFTALVTDEGTFPTDWVIGCTQTPDLVKLLPESVETYRKTLRQINFLANVCLVLTLKQSLSEFYWTNVTEADAPFVGIIEQTNWADRSEFNRKHLVYISAYVAQDDPRLGMDAEALLHSYLPSIQRMFPDFDLEVVESQVLWRANYAQPIVHVGYRHTIPDSISPIPNFFVCTMAQIYPNDRQVSNGVRLARKTAEIVKQKIFTDNVSRSKTSLKVP